MNIRQLRSFVVLAETLHFGQAAQRLNITQPPLSRQITALEDTVGTMLFERHSRSVMLTAAGMSFYKNVARLLDELDAAVMTARAHAVGDSGELKVAFTMYSAWNVLPEAVSNFSGMYPKVTLILNETLPRDLNISLINGEADVGISFTMKFNNQLRTKPLYREPLCAVLPYDHPLADLKKISVQALAQEPFVTFPKSTAPALHKAVMDCCEKYNFVPEIKVEAHLQQTIVNLVAKGLGVALVPNSMRRMQLEGARFISLEESNFIEQSIYWRENNTNPCLKHFIQCFKPIKNNSYLD